MTIEFSGGKPTQMNAPGARAQALTDFLQREFGVPFCVFDLTNGTCWNGTSEQVEEFRPQLKKLGEETEGHAWVRYTGEGTFQLILKLALPGVPTLVAFARMPFVGAQGLPSQSALLQHQRALYRWLNSIHDKFQLENQLREKRRSERAQAAQNSTTWDALMTLNTLARRLRAHKGPKGNHEQILKAAFGFASSEALYWIPVRAEAPVLIEGATLISDPEARQLAHALGRCPELKAPAPLFFNRVVMTKWGWRFPQIQSLVAFLVTDQGQLGWFIAMNRANRQVFRRSDAALLLPFVAMLELQLRWSQRNKDLKALLVGLTQSLANALDAKDPYTLGHSERVARVAVELGKEMGMRGEELGQIYLAGLLHDVGKIGVRDTILQKRGPLTPEEQEQVKQHVMIGYWILAELRPIRHLLPAVLHHHERYDGTGYPAGLADDRIPLHARVLAVADAYDAMSHQRPYRESLPYHRVEATLVAGAGTQWDKEVVDAFLRCQQKIRAINRRPISHALRQAIEATLAVNSSPPLSGPHTRPVGGMSLARLNKSKCSFGPDDGKANANSGEQRR
jgi:HD-GYP domain-containing protein (c-di-GMP phosphodiesterase class II)